MRGSFTLPGEAGHEELTLKLAEKWGADVIRDSDGTQLSDALLESGNDIYSTICLIRSINGFAKQHPDMLQQCLLMSRPVMSPGGPVDIRLMDGYSKDQFRINDGDGMCFWQVFDRTAGVEVPRGQWWHDQGVVTIEDTVPWHRYTVNFFAFRIWEAISMYNHITNNWGDKERLMPVEPRHPEVQRALLNWLESWCIDHPHTDVVRFTSMFYNFAWIWSDEPAARDLFSDWASYDFSVNPMALRAFREETGMDMTSEDFIRGGLRNPTHNAPTDKIRRWMDFTHAFVASFGRQCIDIVHKYGKKAYVFYDDSWIGLEPYGPNFKAFGFDGIIKCVFNGFEARLCADTPHVITHEIRLHPYLFPTGLKGEPTFAPGGDPTSDLWRYWVQVRRALLRKPVDRIGLGGYLHLVEPFPDFCDAVATVSEAFEEIKSIHEKGAPRVLPGKVAVLTAWGALRSWSTSGHLHEHPEIDLTNVLEALSGLPVEVVFLSFDDIRENGIPADVRVLLSAGWAGSAWSGGDVWRDPALCALITEWVYQGGGIVGIGEPSAPDAASSFALGHLFGVERDDGSRKCLRKYTFTPEVSHFITEQGAFGLLPTQGVYVDASDTSVLCAQGSLPLMTVREAGNGRAVYLSGYRFSMEAARLMLRVLCFAGHTEVEMDGLIASNPLTDCALYPDGAIVVNNTGTPQATRIPGFDGTIELPPYGQICIEKT